MWNQALSCLSDSEEIGRVTAPKGVDPRFCSPKGEQLMYINVLITVKVFPYCMYCVLHMDIVLREYNETNILELGADSTL